MTALYLLSTIVGVGLLLFSSLGGGDHSSDSGDVADLAGGHHGADHLGHAAGHAAGAGDFLLGLFGTRNLTFLLAAFGVSGLLLTWVGAAPLFGAVIASALGVTAMLLTHLAFTWLRRTDSAVATMGDHDFEGTLGRVVLPLAPGVPGQVACLIGGREVYLSARLAEHSSAALPVGREIIVMSAVDGVAVVIPTPSNELPPLNP